MPLPLTREGTPVVRPFPRTISASASALVAVGCLVVGAVGHSAVAFGAPADPLKSRKHHVEARIAGARADLDESSAQVRHATEALLGARAELGTAQLRLAATRGRLSAATALDSEMRARLHAARLRLRRAQADLRVGQSRISAEERLLREIVVADYQGGDPALLGLSMVLTSQDPEVLTAQLGSVHSVIDKQSVVLDRLEAARALLTVQEHQVSQDRAQVAVQRGRAAANLARRQRLEARAEVAEASVQRLVGVRARARQAAGRARVADVAQLAGLQDERDRIAAVLRKRADAARAAARSRAGSAGPVHSNGFLDYPVSGPVTSPFGWRIHPIFGYRSLHDGIDFGAACGTPIRAAAAGTVVERYFQTAWGNRVVIDHGLHRGVALATITNHMNAPAIVAPGQHVKRGQVVGYVGTTGWSTGCHLHFTVLQNGTAVNPENWF